MKVFDYATYWGKEILPRWAKLDPKLRDLCFEASRNDTVGQGPDCHLNYHQVDKDLYQKFEALDDETLAYIGVVGRSISWSHPSEEIASYYLKQYSVPAVLFAGIRVEYLTDHVLSKRLGVGLGSNSTGRIRLWGGTLKLCFSSSREWRFDNIGLPTQSNLSMAAAYLGDSDIVVTSRSFDTHAEALLNLLTHPESEDRPLVTVDNYMVSEEERDYRKKQIMAEVNRQSLPTREPPKSDEARVEYLNRELESSPIRCDKVTTINHRLKEGARPVESCEPRHMFMLTRKHLENTGVTLDPNAAPCGICGLSHDQHESDKVAVIEVTSVVSDKDIQEALKPLVPLVKLWGIDGFVFVSDDPHEKDM